MSLSCPFIVKKTYWWKPELTSNVGNSSQWVSIWAPGSVWRGPRGGGNFGLMAAGWAAGREQLQEGTASTEDRFKVGLLCRTVQVDLTLGQILSLGVCYQLMLWHEMHSSGEVSQGRNKDPCLLPESQHYWGDVRAQRWQFLCDLFPFNPMFGWNVVLRMYRQQGSHLKFKMSFHNCWKGGLYT